MPNASTTWPPTLLADPATFRRVLAEPVLGKRMRAWPGFADMLVGESLRHGRRPDPEAMAAVRELYAFGLGNGLPLRERLDAAEALRAQLVGSTGCARAWDGFLSCDPAPEVVLAAAEGCLDTDPAGAAALCALIEGRACLARGALLGALLRQGVAEHLALAGPLRHALDLGEVADALGCCGEAPLPAASQGFLADWLDSLDATEEPALSDLLAQGVTRQRAPSPDIRRVADHFMPAGASETPILRPLAAGGAQQRAAPGADLPA